MGLLSPGPVILEGLYDFASARSRGMGGDSHALEDLGYYPARSGGLCGRLRPGPRRRRLRGRGQGSPSGCDRVGCPADGLRAYFLPVLSLLYELASRQVRERCELHRAVIE